MEQQKGQIDEIPGKWDATDWRNSLIERPAKLPDWVEVGEWVYCTQTGNYGKVHAIDETNADICINNNEVFPVKTKAILQNGKPARLRPYTADEMKALIGKVVFYSTNAYMCVNFHAGDNATVDYGPYRHTAKDLLEYGATIDGKPAGVFEHLENGEWGK